MLIAAIPNMEKIYVLSSLPGITRHWNLQLTLMQVLSDDIFNLCLPPFTFFTFFPNPHYKQYDVIPLSAEHLFFVISAMINIPTLLKVSQCEN